jgi:signal transduction histidine kinase
VVAVVFQPVRERLQRVANRLVYGKRATPYEVIADFSHRMAGTLSIDEVLPRIAEAAAQGVGAQASRVRLFLPDGSEQSSTWPATAEDPTFDRTLTVAYHDEPIGEIAVAPRAGEQLTPVEERLLGDLAVQTELVLHNVRLTRELQARLEEISVQAQEIRASRQRLVTAQDGERRRLERALDAGVQRELGEIAAQLTTAERVMRQDPVAATMLLDTLTAQANSTLDDLRDLARGIYPPLLVDRGLIPALEAHVRKRGIDATVSADADVRDARFPPQVEAAAYFSCVEALQSPGGGTVRIVVHDAGDAIELAMAPLDVAAIAVHGLRDRIEALDGELISDPVTLHVRLPASAASAALEAAG